VPFTPPRFILAVDWMLHKSSGLKEC